ncbi:hypothetical protein GQ54DRAFT_299544 [Martensiomyces pterosporus]|nr:hypothetical protein GQ54DRAFT_299544 [Martensiomyces pterosporus]
MAEQETKSTVRFEEFTTVDWIDDNAKERRRLQSLWSSLGTGPLAWARLAYESTVAWIVVLLVGALIGVNTAFISIITEWLSDSKLGVCSTAWWLNEKFCCWESVEEDQYGVCSDWVTWDRVITGHDLAFVRWLAFVVIGTVLATVCAYLVREYAPLAAGSGLPEIKSILGGFVIRGFMGGWTLLMKSVGLALAVASGLSVGKEGPAVHMGCCIGNVVSRNFSKYRRNYARQREIISASAAAGVAVAFGAPIGGVLFSLEDLSSHFPLKTLWRSFFCALIATVSLQAMNPFRTGKLVMFQATYDRDWHFFEILFFIIIGIFGGVYGGICIRLNLKVTAFRKKYLSGHVVQEVAVLALVTTAITYTNRYTRQDMGELLSYLLRECKDGDWAGICRAESSSWVIGGLLAATLIRAVGTVCAYGCKVPCGIFVPSMAIGATFGRMLGIIAQTLHRSYPKSHLFAQCAPDTPCITPATYAFLGAAAALCGVTKVTVAVVVIMYELTGALNFIVPTMIVVMVARVIGDAIVEGGISEQLILLNGLPFFDEEENLLDTPIASVMRMDVRCISADGVAYGELRRMLDETANFKGFPVVSNEHDMRLVGYVQREAILRATLALRGRLSDSTVVTFGGGSASGDDVAEVGASISAAGRGSRFVLGGERAMVTLAELVNTSPITVSPRTAAETVLEMFRKLGPRVILVANEDGQLTGLLTRKDILKYIRGLHAEEEHGGFDGQQGQQGQGRLRNGYSSVPDSTT